MIDRSDAPNGRGLVGGADSPDVAKDVLRATDQEIADATPDGWFGKFVWKALVALFCGSVTLALVAAFWGLFLLARLLWHGMGL